MEHLLRVAWMSTIAAAAPRSSSLSSRPNFILLMADDMGWGDVSYNNVSSRIANPGAGGDHFVVNPPRTPNLDAMAKGPNSLLFHRFYAASAVCSPTRASALTGRTSDRECIDGAEGCGQEPAWSCADNFPMSPRTFTIAKAAKKQGYATLHIGKWHLGNFFPKASSPHDYANTKWPVSSPRTHGFDEWHSTEASASSSMCNCGCNPIWPSSPGGDANATQGVGCITGGGAFSSKAFPCTNYWSPVDLDKQHKPTNPVCASANASTLGGCVSNMTTKITGNDNVLIMDLFEEFLVRKGPGGSEEAPFLAVLWLHTNHVPHPAMPEWYHAYTDANGDPAGDYLGTLSQMDQQIGRLRLMLKTHGVAENTALWFTADNGPHTNGDHSVHPRSSNQATNGLRQCKASLYEGGIREPGILEWPEMIQAHRETEYPAYVSDYLPTFLDALGATHPDPTWAADGISLLPLLRAAAAQEPNDALVTSLNRSQPLGFKLGKQLAWIDNEYKLVRYAHKGQCQIMYPPYISSEGVYLFNLASDPTESHDLSKSDPARFTAMSNALDAWAATIPNSQVQESQCTGSSPSPPGPGPPSPGPTPGPPGPPPAGGVSIKVKSSCLTSTSEEKHAGVVLGDCGPGSKWLISKSNTSLTSVGSKGFVMKRNAQKGAKCIAGDAIQLGVSKGGGIDIATRIGADKGTVVLIVTGGKKSTLKGNGDDVDRKPTACELCVGIDATSNAAVLTDCAKATVFTVEEE